MASEKKMCQIRDTYEANKGKEGVMIAARFYTLVKTCKLNGVSPRDYFVKVLKALTNDYGDYEKLTPDRINEI